MLEAGGEFVGKAGRPRGVDEAEFEEVAEVHAIFAMEGRELHTDERFEGDDAEFFGALGLGDIRGGGVIIRADFFVGNDDVDGVAGFGVGAVEEDVEAGGVAVDEACGFEGAGGGGEIGAAKKDVDVLGVANRAGIDRGDPGSDGVATGDGVGDAGGFEGSGGTKETSADAFHGEHHPVEKRGVGRNSCARSRRPWPWHLLYRESNWALLELVQRVRAVSESDAGTFRGGGEEAVVV